MFLNNIFAMISFSLFELFKGLVFLTIEIDPSQHIQCLLRLKFFLFLHLSLRNLILSITLVLSSLLINPTSSNTAEAMAAAARSDTKYISQVRAKTGRSHIRLFGVILSSTIDVEGVVGTTSSRSSTSDSAERCSESKLKLIF